MGPSVKLNLAHWSYEPRTKIKLRFFLKGKFK
jgi:hypothetical protein